MAKHDEDGEDWEEDEEKEEEDRTEVALERASLGSAMSGKHVSALVQKRDAPLVQAARRNANQGRAQFLLR